MAENKWTECENVDLIMTIGHYL